MISNKDAEFIPADFNAVFKEVVAKRPDLLKRGSGRMALPGSGSTTHYAGEVLGYATSGGDAGKWKPYASGNSDGSQVAKAILLSTIIVDSTNNNSEIEFSYGGQFLQDLLIGLDSGAITNLKAISIVENGVNILSF